MFLLQGEELRFYIFVISNRICSGGPARRGAAGKAAGRWRPAAGRERGAVGTRRRHRDRHRERPWPCSARCPAPPAAHTVSMGPWVPTRGSGDLDWVTAVPGGVKDVKNVSRVSRCNGVCPAGPALLFVKVSHGREEGRRFFACSACRDRKDCNFFQWEDEKVSEGCFRLSKHWGFFALF